MGGMSDLIKRLRKRGDVGQTQVVRHMQFDVSVSLFVSGEPLCLEAAAEIERLMMRVSELETSAAGADPYDRHRADPCADCVEDHGRFYCALNCGPPSGAPLDPYPVGNPAP